MIASISLISLLIQERDDEYQLDGARNYLLLAHAEEIDVTNKNTTVKAAISQDNNSVNDSLRLKIAEWSFEVVDYFTFDREVVAIALNYIDRFVVFENRSNPSTKQIGKRAYQLLILTSLYLAIKLHGKSSDESNAVIIKPPLRMFVDLSQNQFNAIEIEEMERKLLGGLRWRVNPPISITFVQCFLEYLPNWQTQDGLSSSCHRMKYAMYEMARYLTEISVCTASCSFLFKPSLIAYASILVAIDVLEQDCSFMDVFPPSQVLADFVRHIFKETSLIPSMKTVKEARSMLIEMCPKTSRREFTTSVSPISCDWQDSISEHGSEGYAAASEKKNSPSPTAVLYPFHAMSKHLGTQQ